MLTIHGTLVIALAGSHLYYSSLQSREGELFYALTRGSGAYGLKRKMKKVPLDELYLLGERVEQDKEPGKNVWEVIKERESELYDMETPELEKLALEAHSLSLRRLATKIVESRLSHKRGLER